MPITPDDTGTVSNLGYAVDTHAAAAGDDSIFSNISDLATKAIPLTGLSIVNSFVNTAITIDNWMGGDNKQLTVQDEVGDGDLNDYYNRHSSAIEGAGLIAGSLIPGTAGIKALRMAQEGKLSSVMQMATNMFAGPKDRLVQGALQEILNPETSQTASIVADKFKAIALGFGDQALQGLAYEAATTATMFGSPIINKETYGDIAQNLAMGAVGGGLFGGLVEGVGTAWAFRKAQLAAGTAIRTSELVGRLGDKTASFLDSDRALEIVRMIPGQPSELGGSLGRLTRDRNYLNSVQDLKIALQPSFPDPAAASDFGDLLINMKNNGQQTEDIYARLNRFVRADRVDSNAAAPETGTFYVNNFAKKDAAAFTDMVSNSINKDAKVARAFRLKDGATEVKVARFDTAIDPKGVLDLPGDTPLFSSSQEAFDNGYDIFLNRNLQPVVNPKAPNIEQIPHPGESRILSMKEQLAYRKNTPGQLPEGSKPLLGGTLKEGQSLTDLAGGPDASFANQPMYINLKNGDLSDSVTPIVGDSGEVKLLSTGLKYGDNFSQQSADTSFNSQMSTIDANARYVWANLRGIKKGDLITGTDLPMLEQLYRQANASNQTLADFVKTNNINFAKDAEHLGTLTDLKQQIIGQKNNLITDLLSKDNPASADEIALHANVKPAYLSDGANAATEDNLFVDPASYQKTNSLKLWYDINNINSNDGNIVRGMVDFGQRKQLITDTVQTNLTKFAATNGIQDAERFILSGDAGQASPLGVRPGFLTATQSDYNSLGQQAERVGRSVARFIEEKGKKIGEALSNSIQQLRNNYATDGAELAMFTAVRQRTNQIFKELPADLAAEHFPNLQDGQMVAVLKNSVAVDPKTKALTWDKNIMPDGFLSGDGYEASNAQKGTYNYYILSKNVADFERETQKINGARLISRNQWRSANGLRPDPSDPAALYAPPIDTGKYPYFAMVKATAGKGGVDDSVGMIVAKNAAELQQKIASIPKEDFQVFTKNELSKDHKVIGDYDYQRAFQDNYVNSELKRRGILSDIYPDSDINAIIARHNDWHIKSETALIRDHVETGNGQLFAELQAMAQQTGAPSESVFGRISFLQSKPVNPYQSYIDTSLNIKNKENYRPWAAASEKVEQFFDTAFNAARSGFMAATKGRITYDQAVAAAEKFGLGNPFGNVSNFTNLTNKLPPQRYLSQFLSQASSALNFTTIRLDAWQQIVDALSTPILLSAELNSANNAMKALTTVELPQIPGVAAGQSVPGIVRIMYNAVSNLFDREHMDQWKPIYNSIGALRNPESELIARQMREDMVIPYGRGWSQSDLVKKGDSIIKAAGQLSNWTEFVQSFVVADSARQLFQAKGMEGQQLTDNILSFVNRVKGNNVASQRPIAFQGALGQAVGLFQTYQLNVLQNAYRYIGEGEGKSLLLAGSLQTSLFGLGSLPGFSLMNSQIIGNSRENTQHQDLYSSIPGYFGKVLGDYLLYGSASNLLNASLYTRGDMNPRQLSLLPVNPLDYPAISGGVRLYQALRGTEQRIANGAPVGASLLIGLEHNGLSRPLMGLAQLAQGFSTTADGNLQSRVWPGAGYNPNGDNTPGFNELFNAGIFSRLLGARPLEEAVALDAAYRNTAYQAHSTAQMTALGSAVKTTLYGNSAPSQGQVEDFAARYAAIGGDITKFNSKMIEWTTAANSSIANQVYTHLGSKRNQNMMSIMGGQPLADWRSGSSTQAAGY